MSALLLIVSGLFISFGREALKYWALMRGEAATEPVQEPELPPNQPATDTLPADIPTPPPMIKREHLYAVAKACRGRDMSPLDRAPDSLGCMESLDGVYLEAFGEHLLSSVDRLGTARGYAVMMRDPRLQLINNADALPGDIVISPSGTSTKGAQHGHTGIRGMTTYMSNDSSTGLWTANYNLPNWDLVFHKTLGFPVFHFRVKGEVA